MNKFKADFATNKLLLDIRKPERKDFDYRDLSFLNDYVHENEYNAAIEAYNSRLSYSLSPELRDKLKDGEVIGENEFSKLYQQLFTGNYFSKAAWLNSTEEQYQYLSEDYRRIIAIPLPKEEAVKSLKERSDMDLLELVCQLHSRALNFPSKEMHDAYIEARTELETRIKGWKDIAESNRFANTMACEAVWELTEDKKRSKELVALLEEVKYWVSSEVQIDTIQRAIDDYKKATI